MLQIFTKIFGTKSERDLKAIRPYLTKINEEYQKLAPLSNDALRAETKALQNYLQGELQEVTTEIQTLENELERDNAIEQKRVDNITKQIQELQNTYNAKLEKVLLEILPKAFAIVKETARRFTENTQLTVSATDYDKYLATTHKNIAIEDDKAIWHNQWEVAGHLTTWDMIHYDEQLMGGIILHQGKIAEMATGEGKTLVSTLPIFLNALVGKGVHVVTVNDYLAKRDAAWNKPIFQFHGLRVACIEETPPHSAARRAAYQADVIYGTNNEFGFDYLRDNMATRLEEVVQRSHHYAIVDEVDSVLIDDARTPLIISGPVEQDTEKDYIALNPLIRRLYDAQKQLVNNFLQAAKQDMQANEDKAGLALFRAYRGLPKYKPLIKYLSEPGVKQLLHKKENYYIQDNARMMPEADAELLFTIDEKHNSVELTEKGLAFMAHAGNDPQFFILPDIATALTAIDKNHDLDLAAREQQKQKLTEDYAIKAQRIHVAQQLLKAYTLFELDTEYVILEGKVKIVDEQTGRILEGRRYSDGLHQAIEAKEGVKIEKASQTYATITLQNYFRLYRKLAGMTGTAETEAGEFHDIYHLDVVVTPTHKTMIREDKEDIVYKTAREKFTAIIEEINNLASQGRPVLVGTTSVEISELVSKMLTLRKIKHQVLNAKQHQKEAEIVAQAGQASTVTIATNMAGRGTDIKLSEAAREAGGLAIIGTERHDSRRVDRQLRGRAGRQGDVGSSQFFVSLEDSLMRLFISDRIAKLMDKLGLRDGEMIQHSMITNSIERAQKKVEENNFGYRKRLLEYDNELNKQRTIIYQRRKNALLGKNVHLYTLNLLHHLAEKWSQHQDHTITHYEELNQKLITLHCAPLSISVEKFETLAKNEVIETLYQGLLTTYQNKWQTLQEQLSKQTGLLQELNATQAAYFLLGFTNGELQLDTPVSVPHFITNPGETLMKSLEAVATIYYIDHYWQAHLRNMDELRQVVQNASYEQKDPLLIYKFEAYNLFTTMVAQIDEAIITYLFKTQPLLAYKGTREAAILASKSVSVPLKELKQDFSNAEEATGNEAVAARPKPQPIRSHKIDRNQRITVQYNDGSVKEDVKFKSVEQDIADGKCVIIEQE